MPRIVGVDIPNDKVMGISLTYIHGIGRTTAGRVLKDLGIDHLRKARDLTDEEITRISNHIEQHLVVEGQLRRVTQKGLNVVAQGWGQLAVRVVRLRVHFFPAMSRYEL